MTSRLCACGALLLATRLVGCSSDSSADGGNGGSTSAGTGGSAAGSGGVSSGGAAGSAATGGSNAAGASSGGSGVGGSSGSSSSAGGACAMPQELRNDSLDGMGQAAFQGGFKSGECWGSTYDASALDCSYAFSTLQVLIGGAATSKTFRIEIWTVDATGKPLQKKKHLDALLQGSDTALNEIDIKELTEPLFQDSAFAVAMCLTEHDGLPAVARDTDGIQASKNWVFDGATWTDAGSLGVAGDWIMRVGVTPK